MKNIKTVRYIVTGKVQGVWFRQSTKQKALEIGMSGNAINLTTGQVEVTATGDTYQHQQLIKYLNVGPILSNVISVEKTDMTLQLFDEFITG